MLAATLRIVRSKEEIKKIFHHLHCCWLSGGDGVAEETASVGKQG